MKRNAAGLIAAALVFTLPADAAGTAAAREGTTLVIEFTATLKTALSTSVTTSTIERVLKGRCKLEARGLMPYGVMGPTKEQERAMQNAQPSTEMADLEKEVAKCKGDQACMMRLAERAANAKAPEGASGTIQTWFPQSCSGSFKVDERHDTNDPGGEGGGGAYRQTTTIKGMNVIKEGGEDGWHGAFIDHDVAKNVTTYHFTNIEPMEFETRSTRTGHNAGVSQGKASIALLGAEFPNPWAAQKGPPAAGKTTKKADGGTLTVEWLIKR